MSDDHVRLNRGSWDEDAANWVERGREAWALEAPVWGRGNPESELQLLPDVAGLDAIELGCGTAYVSAWLKRLGARVVGLDNSSRQLATARVFQEEFGLHFPLVHADAEHAPFADGSFDFAISQYGAAIWCDPYRWIPEAFRILRPGGRLVFETGSPLVMLCFPADDDEAPAELAAPSRLLRHAPFRVAGQRGRRRRDRVPSRSRGHDPGCCGRAGSDRGSRRDPGACGRDVRDGSVHPARVGAALAERRGVEGTEGPLMSVGGIRERRGGEARRRPARARATRPRRCSDAGR